MINVDRSIVKEPEIGNDWRNEATMEALGIVFANKCYICEKKKTSPYLFTVDHFIPQVENADLIYEWTNLHLCCGECNGTRQKSTPEGGFLDPCNPNDDVEKEIVYRLEPYEFDKPVFFASAVNPANKVKNTIKQLKRCHYGSKKTKIKYESFERKFVDLAEFLILLKHNW